MFGTKKKGKKCDGCGEVHEKGGKMGEALTARLLIEAMRMSAKDTLGYEMPLVVVKTDHAIAVDARVTDEKQMRKILIALFQEDMVADIAREILEEDEE